MPLSIARTVIYQFELVPMYLSNFCLSEDGSNPYAKHEIKPDTTQCVVRCVMYNR